MSGLRRWGGYLAFVVLFSVACGLLSWWQWARRAEAIENVQRIEANYDADPVPLTELLPDPDAWDPAVEWRPVTVEGRYLADETLLVRSRPFQGQPGFEVLVPLQLDDGRVFLVDRGWMVAGDDSLDPADPVPAPPAGEVTAVARLKPEEPQIPGRSAPPGQLATIHLSDAYAQLAETGWSAAYGLLDSEDPAAATRPTPALRPEEDEGPHLSYALQWILFALIAITGLVWAIRRERMLRRQAEGEEPPAPRRRTRPTDADIEDALLDAQRQPAAN
ncbi:MAG: SURF1 family protein [Actinomycetales bacterium]|nr:SURF1 family protein [Actinomycetales bacterium]